MSNKTAVIGLGSTIRRDDGIGIAVLESLLGSFKREDADYLNFGTASFDLIYRLKDYDTVVLIDAIDASLKPGELKIFELNKIKLGLKSKILSSHELDLKALGALTKKFAIKAKIYVAGIQVKDVSFGEGVTAQLTEKKPDIVKRIGLFVDTLFCSLFFSVFLH